MNQQIRITSGGERSTSSKAAASSPKRSTCSSPVSVVSFPLDSSVTGSPRSANACFSLSSDDELVCGLSKVYTLSMWGFASRVATVCEPKLPVEPVKRTVSSPGSSPPVRPGRAGKFSEYLSIYSSICAAGFWPTVAESDDGSTRLAIAYAIRSMAG